MDARGNRNHGKISIEESSKGIKLQSNLRLLLDLNHLASPTDEHPFLKLGSFSSAVRGVSGACIRTKPNQIKFDFLLELSDHALSLGALRSRKLFQSQTMFRTD